jgi:hypothetical protein
VVPPVIVCAVPVPLVVAELSSVPGMCDTCYVSVSSLTGGLESVVVLVPVDS